MAFKTFNLLSLFAGVSLVTLANAAPVNDISYVGARWNGVCKPIYIIGARGTYQAPGIGNLAEVIDVIDNVNPDVLVDAVDYPATMDNYEGSVKMGTIDLQKKIRFAAQKCPGVKIALFGYSQGANVVADALFGSSENGNGVGALEPQFADNVKSVVLFGDPTHSAPQNFVKGSGFNNGMIPRYADLTGGQFAGRIASWCNSGDPICDSGSDMNQHLTYMDVYKESAAYFTLANLAH